MTILIQSEAYVIGIEKALDDSERTVGSIVEPQKDGSMLVVATFNEAVATVIEELATKARVAEERVKRLEAQQRRISLKPHVYRELVNQLRDTAVKYAGCQQLREQISRTLQYALVADNSAPVPDVSAVARAALDYIDALPDEVVATLPAMPGFDRDWAEEILTTVAAPAQRTLALANETIDFERLCEIAEEDKGSDVAFESSIMARMLIGVAMNSEPVAFTDSDELRFPHATSDMWPAPLGHGRDVPLYTVQQLNDRERAELTSYRWLVERLEAALLPDCPAFDAACRALWEREPHRILEKAGYPIDYDSQPPAIKAGLKRQVLTVLRTVEKEVRGEG
ncbi:hypothetical protein ACYJ2I_004069 [Enterobacter hormaechei]